MTKQLMKVGESRIKRGIKGFHHSTPADPGVHLLLRAIIDLLVRLHQLFVDDAEAPQRSVGLT